jgi:hypothetical protein
MLRRTLVGAVAAAVLGSSSLAPAVAQDSGSLSGQARTFTVTRDVPFTTVVATFTDPQPGDIADTAAYVDHVYRDLLGRPVDAPGGRWWVAALDGGLARPAVTPAVVSSREWAGAVVRSAYQEILGRAAASGETGPWADAIVHGSQVSDVRALLLGSDEFLRHHGGTVDGFVDGLWQTVLGRPVDDSGRAWVQSMLAAGSGRAGAAHAVLVTAEAWGRRVEAWYQALLGRSAGAGGRGYWVPVLTSGTPEQAVPVAITASNEYVSHLPNDYVATIGWGDAPVALARVRHGAGDTIEVVSGNRLPVDGTAPVTVNLAKDGGDPVTVTGKVTVEGPRNERFVTGLAQDLLGYPLTGAGATYWTPWLLSGGRAARTRVAQGFVASSDGRLRAVVSIFDAYLGRTPDASGAAPWVATAGKQGLLAVRVGLLSSDEFVRKSGGTNDAWADALYQKVLGRPAGDAGRAYVGNLLASGQARWMVARAILGSDEAHADLLHDVYQAVLTRAPGAGEQALFVSWMRTSVSEERLQAILAGSLEYFDAFPASDT